MARPIVRILSRYLLRQHLAPLAFALAALTSFMLLNQVAKQFHNLAGKGLPAGIIAEMFALSVPFIVAMTLPMAVLVAVLHAFTRLGADTEIVALKAAGVGVGRMLAPVLGGAALISLLAFLWSDQVLPRSNHRLRTLLGDIQRKRPTLTLKEQVINEVLPNQFFLRAARIDQASNRLRDVTIYDLGDAERRRVITADSGRMAYTPEGRDLYLTLMDGDIREVRREDPAQFNRTFYTTNQIRVAAVGNTLQRTEQDTYRGDREMTICAMEAVVVEARADAAVARAQARAATTNELRRLAGLAAVPSPEPAAPDSGAPPRGGGPYCRALALLAGWLAPPVARAQTPRAIPPRTRPAGAERPAGVGLPAGAVPSNLPAAVTSITPGIGLADEQRARSARQRAAMFEVEIHKKLAISAACLVFALVGVPVALRFPRGGTGLVLVVSVAVFAVYYVGLIGGEELGDRLIVSPFVAMWTPNLIFTFLGLVGLRLARRPGASAHGGAWSDLREAFRLPRWAP